MLSVVPEKKKKAKKAAVIEVALAHSLAAALKYGRFSLAHFGCVLCCMLVQAISGQHRLQKVPALWCWYLLRDP